MVSVFQPLIAKAPPTPPPTPERELNNKCKDKSDLLEDKKARINTDPPAPAPKSLIEKIVRKWCLESSPDNLEEQGCAVCGQLTPSKDMSLISSERDLNLACLINIECSRKERNTTADSVDGWSEPIIEKSCSHICKPCLTSLKKGKRPKFALANGLWVGEIPAQLKDLTFAEQMLIGRVRHNRCLIRVASSGRAKMIANAIMFQTPVVKVYHTLPVSVAEASDVIAVIFMGNTRPTAEEYKRTPMLDYADLEISKENLEQYPLSGVPVVVDFKKVDDGVDATNQLASELSKHETEVNVASSSGPCSLILKALAHMDNQGLAMGIGQDSTPVSMYDNPQLYPQMFPWLFPYGYGGIGQHRHKKAMSEEQHKKRLLMYYDKRFQTDFYFPMIAFNHEQIKSNVTSSFLMTKKANFESVVEKVASIDPAVFKDMCDKMVPGAVYKPETDEEKKCYSIMEELDH
ncbi:hypothetical protein DFP72DRAFT_797921, partial [Ephemerocybe angulata]